VARRQGRRDPKEAALAQARCLNPHPEQVTDAEFLASDFFDARDAVQVKYEMVRKVRACGAPVTEAATAFGYSRPAYYAASSSRPATPRPRLAATKAERRYRSVDPENRLVARGLETEWETALGQLDR
jgi:hypothetical protein